MNYQTPEHIADCIKQNADKESMYIYDMEKMRAQMRSLLVLPENVQTFYAMKVNPNVEVVSEALKHKSISGIEVASQGEIDKVFEAGESDASRIIYTGPSKKPTEINFSVENNIQYLNVESIVEAVRINEEAKKKGIVQPILLRLNTKHKFKPGEAGVILGSGATQFGVPQGTVEENLQLLSQLENIRIEGFHMYPATGVMDANVLLKSVEASFQFLQELEEKTGKTYKTLDFGGGFGIDYGGERKFDVNRYAEGLEELIEKYQMIDKTLILELGRYIGSEMGYFVTRINDIKDIGENDKGEMVKGLLCNAGTNAHKRPQVLGVDYHVDIIQTNSKTEKEIQKVLKELGVSQHTLQESDLFNVYGPFCTSVDKVISERRGHIAQIGDFVVMPQAGAYGLTMSPQEFLSHPKVPEIVINK